MADSRISYLNRTFDDYKNSLREYIEQYYPQIASDLNDASVGSWMVDMVALIGDNLSYYIDKAYNETNIDTARQRNSVLNLARSYGLKVPGPKGSVALCEFSAELPVYTSGNANSSSSLGMPDMAYAPIIKKGTKVSSRNQVFEVMNDINFNEEFDYNGFPNRDIIPVTDSQGRIIKYKVVKKEVVVAGETRIYKQAMNNPNEIHPFMEIVIPDNDVMNVESIIFKDGVDFQSDPSSLEFTAQSEKVEEPGGVTLYRFFEVDSLVDNYRWGDAVSGFSNAEVLKYSSYSDNSDETLKKTPVYGIVRGEWKPVMQKFITEFTDNGYLKVIFGSGDQIGSEIDTNMDNFAKYQISKIVRNDFLGKLPPFGSTMYIQYRVGGGMASNVASNTITNVQYLNCSFSSVGSLDSNIAARVKKSISVTNPYPSVTGKDAPTIDEIKAMIKYNSSTQKRCITVKDYENRISLMPPRYGTPYRIASTEENNKVMLYVLGINSDGTLSNVLPEQMIANILNYLAMYRTVNDYVEIKSGRIVNIGVDADVFIDKSYNIHDVIGEVISVIRDFFDISKHQLGETIYLSKLTKAITDINGVMNLIELRVFNKTGAGYSTDMSIDPVITDSEFSDAASRDYLIDIRNTGYQLNSDTDAMFEIKYPNSDIRVRSMVR